MALDTELERKARAESLRTQINTMIQRKPGDPQPKPAPATSANEAIHRRMTELNRVKDK